MKSLRLGRLHKAVKASPSMSGMRLQRGYSLVVTLLTVAGLSAGGVGYYTHQDGKIDGINAHHQRTGIELETIVNQVYGYYKANTAWPSALNPAIGSQLQGAQSIRWTRCRVTGTAFVTPDCTPITGALIGGGSNYQITANYSTAEMAAVVVGIVPGADISISNPSSVVVTLQPPVEWPGYEQWLARGPISRANQLETDINLGGNDINNIDTLNAVTLNIIDPNAAANTPNASITATGSTLNLNDDVNISGGLTVAGAIDAKDSLAVGGKLHAKNDASVEGNIDAKNNVTVGGELYAKNDVIVDGDLDAKKNVSVGGKLHAKNDVAVEGNLDAKKNVIVGGELHAKNDVSVEGNLDAKKNVTVGGELYAKNGVSVEGDLDAKKNVTVGGKLHAKNNVTVEGNLDANKNVTVGGKLHAENGVTVEGDLEAQKNLTVGGELYAKNNVTVAGDLGAKKNVTVGGKLHAENDVTVEGNLNAAGKVTIDGALHAKDSLTVDGTLQANQNLNVDGVLNAGVINADTLNADDANLTGALSASQINVGADGASISANGSTLNLAESVNIAGDLGVDGGFDLNGALELDGQLSVDGGFSSGPIAADSVSANNSVSTPLINIGNTSIDSNGTTMQLNAETVYLNAQSTLGGNLDANGNDMIGINAITVKTATIGDLKADNLSVTNQLIAGATTLESAAIAGNLDTSGDASFAQLSASEVTADKGTFSKLSTTNLTANNATFSKADIATLKVTGNAAVKQVGAASGSVGALNADNIKATFSTSDTITTDQLHTFNGETLALDLPDLSATNLDVRDHLQVDKSASFTSGSTTGDLTAKSVSAANLTVAGLLKTQNLTVNTASLGATNVMGKFTSTGKLQSTTVEATNQMRTTGAVSGTGFTATGLARDSNFFVRRNGEVLASVDANRASTDAYYSLLDHCVNTSKFCIPEQPEATIKCRANYNCSAGASTAKDYTVYLDADISACRQGCKFYWRMPDPDGIERLHLPKFQCAVALNAKDWSLIPPGQTDKTQCQVDFSDVPPTREVRGSVLLIVKNAHYSAPRGEPGSWKVVKEFYVSYTNTSPKAPAESTENVASAY